MINPLAHFQFPATLFCSFWSKGIMVEYCKLFTISMSFFFFWSVTFLVLAGWVPLSLVVCWLASSWCNGGSKLGFSSPQFPGLYLMTNSQSACLQSSICLLSGTILLPGSSISLPQFEFAIREYLLVWSLYEACLYKYLYEAVYQYISRLSIVILFPSSFSFCLRADFLLCYL